MKSADIEAFAKSIPGKFLTAFCPFVGLIWFTKRIYIMGYIHTIFCMIIVPILLFILNPEKGLISGSVFFLMFLIGWALEACSSLFPSPDALYNTGLRYEIGHQVVQDYYCAAHYIRSAALRGHAQAQYHLASLFMMGRGVKKNLEEAANWCRKAAEQEHKEAQFAMGCMYCEGAGVPKDREAAVMWFNKAAALGYVKAILKLAFLYEENIEQTKDYANVIKWYGKAAECGHAQARALMEEYCNMMKAESPKETQAAKISLQKAETGDADAQYDIGKRLLEGMGVKRDIERAIFWLNKSAEQGCVDAQFLIGMSSEDCTEAAKWLNKAANQGHAQAQFQMGQAYLHAAGVPQNYEEALTWLQKSANQGNADAFYTLAQMHDEGVGIEENSNKAAEYYLESAKLGNAKAQHITALNEGPTSKTSGQWLLQASIQGNLYAQVDLAFYYENGLGGFAKNVDEGLKWYQMAACQGNEIAQERLTEYGLSW